jgi:hypothetical protein
MIAGRLADLRSTHLDQVVDCLALLIDSPTDPWFVAGSRDHIRAIIADGLLSAGDPTTQRLSREIINKLVARGNASFADLLPE